LSLSPPHRPGDLSHDQMALLDFSLPQIPAGCGDRQSLRFVAQASGLDLGLPVPRVHFLNR
jgi:hypothetical protein